MDAQQMDEPQDNLGEGCPAPTRRAFLTTATLSLTALLLDTNLGCSEKREAPNAAEIENRASLYAVPSKLVTFRETSRSPTGLRESRGLAVSADGAIWVVGDSQVRRLLPATDDGAIALPGPGACLAFGADGVMYVGMGDRVIAYSRAGRKVAAWAPASDRSTITAIAPGKDHVWVADWGTKSVYGYDNHGTLLTTLCAPDERTGYRGIVAPSPHLDIAFAGGDRLYVSNPGMHRIETHVVDGGMISSWGSPGGDLASFCGCCNPVDFALMPGGGFVTGEKGIPCVKIHSADGKFVEFVAGPDQFASNTMSLDLVATPDGRVLVLDSIEGAVRVFSRVSPPPRDVTA